MTSMQFVIQPLPGTDEQFIERLREVSDKANKFGFGTHRIFEQLKIPVKEVVVGPNHIGVLLEDGKAFRVAFSINCERLDLSKSDSSKSGPNNANNPSSSNKNSVPASTRQLARSRARLMRTTGRSGTSGQGSGSRSTGVIIGGTTSSRPLVTVAAPFVPEELISQAEVVLQGKSRNLIIRELQRTNLDVNLAVNNLLSRDDEEAEDTEESGDNYVPEDLISLLDNGFHGENNSVIIDPSDGLFSEEIFSNYSSIRNLLFDRIRSDRNQSNSNADNNQGRSGASGSSALSGSGGLSSPMQINSERESFSRYRDRHYYSSRRWINKDDLPWDKDAESKKKETSSTISPVWISEELQPWPDKNNSIRFKKISALYSEFIALSELGELHQWKWSDAEPFKSEQLDNVYHPKTLSLNLTEKIEHISSNFIRCSVVTESSRVATWMDDQLGYIGAKLEHPAVAYTEFIMDPIMSIHVCSLYTVARTESDNIYWWGVLPFEQRRYLWDKSRSKPKKQFKSSVSEIAVGTQVVMKKCPIYQNGCIGFTCVNGVPKVGQLLNSVWDFNDVCQFKLINLLNAPSIEKPQSSVSSNSSINVEKDTTKAQTSSVIAPGNIVSSNTSKSSNMSNNKESTDRIDMPPPPSPASSTCSDTGSVTSHKRPKRMTTKEEYNSMDTKKDEELWQLKDVVFVEDKIGPIGKVLKVDGDYVAVRFPLMNPNASSSGSEFKDEDWQQCRLLRREDVQVYKTAMISRGPDWLQKLPKKINITHGIDSSNFQLLAVAVDTRGIHVIKKISNKLHYGLYNLYNSKQEQNCQFPTESASFLGASTNNIAMTCNNDCSGNTSTIILKDGNRCLYPIAKDCIGAIRDPQWFDLPPVKSVFMTTISLPISIGSNLKSKVCMTALLFESQKLMQHILRCDVKNALTTLARLEKEDRNEQQAVVDERCDGGRNIFHACAVMCAPTSNKDSEDKKNNPSGTSRPSSCSSIFASSSNSVLDNPGSSSGSSTFPSVNSNLGVSSSNLPQSREGRTVSLREMMNRLINNDSNEQSSLPPNNSNILAAIEDHLYVPAWSLETNTTSNVPGLVDYIVGSEDDISKVVSGSSAASLSTSSNKLSSPSYIFDPTQRREHAILILQQMCSSTALRPYLYQMLITKDAQGQTPFMLAVCTRAYEAGIVLLNTILSLAEKDPSVNKDTMIFPAGSPPDQSPLHVICYNDTCSFTWTGADHINQNIFECKTCGLTGSLCCCTECARVCHKGHDCKLKRTSPTAYCDCWEKCKCKALIAGNQQKRFNLLCKLASSTDLVTKFNSKGESILLFLIQTVGRQTVEQRQYRANSRARNVSGPGAAGGAGVSSRKSSSNDAEGGYMPEHDLEPPKFAYKALEILLVDWHAVRSMIMTGAEKCETSGGLDGNSDGYNVYLQTQSGCTLLDKFTHNLFVKCSGNHLDILLITLEREMQNNTVEGRIADAEMVARRFVRSVARVFVIFNLEKLPNPERRKISITPNKHIQSCIKVFQSMHKIAIEELCEVSEALIAPVRLGVLRPTAPFAMSTSSMDSSDDLFSVEPLAPSSVTENVSEASAVHDSVSDQSNAAYNLQSNYGIDGILGLRESSENDPGNNGRDNNVHVQEEDIIEANRNEEPMPDDESDNDFAFNDAETESDSDDNQSNQDAQRSVQTGATVGSETDIGVLFLEDDSGESSAQDEEGSEDGETDDHSDEFNFADHQLERRSVNSNVRNDLAPQSMQWAIRNRDANRNSVRVPAGSSLVFIDPMALRRSTVPTNSSVATPPQEHHTIATTASNLARAFGIVVRQISELLIGLMYNASNDIEGGSLKIDPEEIVGLQAHAESRLKVTWDWMFSVMDGTEAQLKFGAYLTNYTDPAHPLHPLNLSAQSNVGAPSTSSSSSSSVGMNVVGSSSRREFFTYCLSLMRAHTSEHRDALPVLDITALRHIAYVLDGFIYYMRNDSNFYDKGEQVTMINAMASNENDDADDELTNLTTEESFAADTNPCPTVVSNHRRHSLFFTRSDSTLSLGCLAPEGFDLPLDVSMPLADKPHLLQPNSKREDLFANLPLTSSSSHQNEAQMMESENANILDYPPTRLGFSKYIQSTTHRASESSGSGATAVNNMDDMAVNDEDVDMESNAPTTESAAPTKSTTKNNDTNIYVQLKKKQYSDESRTNPKKTEEQLKPEDIEMKSDDANKQQQQVNSISNDSVMVNRPEIIIAPNKAGIREKSHRSNEEDPIATTSSGSINSNRPMSGAGTSASARSVIVRVGNSLASSTSTAAHKGAHGTDNKDSEQSCGESKKPRQKHPSISFPARGSHFCSRFSSEAPSWNFLLGRWKLTLDLFGRVFMDDVGMENGSVLPELRGFPVKEMRFRRHMEKLRNGQQRDLILSKLERNRENLIIQTFKEFNTQFGSQNRRVHPPLTFNRVKVTFKDEPGEGSGVARSFYTSISEALLANAKMPNLDAVQVGSNSKYGVPFSSILRNRGAGGRDPPSLQRRGTGSKILWRTARERRALNPDARPFVPASSNSNSADGSDVVSDSNLSMHLQQLGERLYPKICSINAGQASKITGMLLEIPTPQLLAILSSEESLRQKVNEALDIINFKQKSDSGCTTSSPSQSKKVASGSLEQCQVEDNDPLFYSPGKRGFYTPRQGYGSFERLNAFRNVGRLIGLCLQQNELLPLFLQRHVLKYILGRKIKFHDLAFFDPTVYESFRKLLQSSQTEEGEETLNRMEIYFVIDLMKEEGGESIELIPGGREIQVTAQNIFEYVRRYTEYRLIKCQEKALEALKDGVFDVLPENCISSLTAEDLRLLLNGVGDINVTTLISYTTFNDESSEGSDKLLKFKRWFWSIIEKMNTIERQDLVYFWTGSPALPASEEGFQPLPSVTIRPADDAHLPTANTCISRLYIPLYSSKSILRSKLLLAIKSKNFGFV